MFITIKVIFITYYFIFIYFLYTSLSYLIDIVCFRLI